MMIFVLVIACLVFIACIIIITVAVDDSEAGVFATALAIALFAGTGIIKIPLEIGYENGYNAAKLEEFNRTHKVIPIIPEPIEDSTKTFTIIYNGDTIHSQK